MIKRSQLLGIVLATTLSAGIGSVAHAAMSAEEAAAELQQAFSLDADITQIVDASVKDGMIVISGVVNDQQAVDKVKSIVEDMDVDESMVEYQIRSN